MRTSQGPTLFPEPAGCWRKLRTNMNDNQIEQAIQAAGKTAPRVTPADIEAEISAEFYFTAYNGIKGAKEELGSYHHVLIRHDDQYAEGPARRLTFCVLLLKNGFSVTGESACASPENFDPQIGRDIARANAINKIWPLMGFRLRDELARPVLTEADSLADLSGEERPDWKGEK